MSAFAVAAFHDQALAEGARSVEAVVWIRAAELGADGLDVALALWTPAGAEVTKLREVAPGTADRLASCARVDDRTVRLDAGRWEEGVHEFELVVALPPCQAGDELLAARVGVLAGGEHVAEALVAVRWTAAAASVRPPQPADGDAGEQLTAAVGHADLPTGPSRQPRPAGAGAEGETVPCPGCGEQPDDGDRFCEACGRELAAG